MKPSRRPSVVAIAIVAFCTWRSSGIVGAWQSDPQNFLGWVALLLWLVPSVYIWAEPSLTNESASFALLWIGLGFSILGSLGSLNAFHYFGFACAVTATVGWSWRLLPWLLSAVAWMPVFAYFASKVVPQPVIMPARVTLALIATGWTLFTIRRATRNIK
jgi:hypothetical protein